MTSGPVTAADWLLLLTQFMSLSFLSISGAIATVPDMHRFLVAEHAWLTDPQFSASVAIAQAAPGPNVLFVALMGWQLGLNSGGGIGAGWHAWLLGAFGIVLTMTGILLPSSVLTYTAARWSQRNRHRRAVRAFRQGMAPLVVGLLVATGWVLAHGAASTAPQSLEGRLVPLHVGLWLLTAASALMVWRTRIHLLWLLGAGAVAGFLGWV